MQDGKIQHRKMITFDYFLAGTAGHRLREKFAQVGEHGKHLYFIEQSLRGFHIEELLQTVGDLIE